MNIIILNLVHKLKIAIYSIALILGILCQMSVCKAGEQISECQDIQCFCPLDFVPHPHPPSTPERNKEDDLAQYAANEGVCGRCGWALQDGQCRNQNCHQYGPNKD